MRLPFLPNPTALKAAGLMLFASLFIAACGTAELPDDGTPPAVSSQAAASFLQKTLDVGQGTVGSRRVRFTVTQEEVTSALNLGTLFSQAALGSLGETSGLGPIAQIPGMEANQGSPELETPNDLLARTQGDDGAAGLNAVSLKPRLVQPEVYFQQDGRMIVRGDLAFLKWSLPVRVVLAPQAAAGELTLDFVEGQIGSAPLPEALFDPIGKSIALVLLAGRDYAEIKEIAVTEGTLTFEGRPKELP